MNKCALKDWTDKQLKKFLCSFTDPTKAWCAANNYIMKVWNNTDYPNYKELPKIVSNNVQYTIGAFKEVDRFIITLMNPKTGAFGKAVIHKKDYDSFSWEYGIALAWARMNNEDYAVLEDEITMNEVKVGQHFLWKDCEWVMTFTSYDRKDKYYYYILYNITERFVKEMTSNHKKQDKVKLID